MARVGGRNSALAWTVGLACALVVGGLVWIAAPLVPGLVGFVGGQLGGPTSGPVADDAGAEAAGPPTECRELYDTSVWRSLVWSDDSILTPSTDAPATMAPALVDALAPAVRLTCGWTGPEGSVSTTLADVPADAGAIARTALSVQGYTCEERERRTRCVREDGDDRETIDIVGGLWVSTLESGWRPAGYVDVVADRVWGAR